MYLKFEGVEMKDCKTFYPHGTLNSFGQQFGVDVQSEAGRTGYISSQFIKDMKSFLSFLADYKK